MKIGKQPSKFSNVMRGQEEEGHVGDASESRFESAGLRMDGVKTTWWSFLITRLTVAHLGGNTVANTLGLKRVTLPTGSRHLRLKKGGVGPRQKLNYKESGYGKWSMAQKQRTS